MMMMDAIPVLEAVDEPVAANEHSVLGLGELLLKDPGRVDRLTREPSQQPELIGRFLALALASFAVFALALVLLLNAAPAAALPGFLRPRWSSAVGPALSLGLAYTLGLVAATGICLPNFYFKALLVGIRVSWLQVTSQVLKGKAATAVMLMGLLPIYVAIVLGLIVFQAAPDMICGALYFGLALPFVAGLRGANSIYNGVMGLADTLPPERRCQRECFLRRLTISWAAIYTIVTPVMIYTLWDYLATRLS